MTLTGIEMICDMWQI